MAVSLVCVHRLGRPQLALTSSPTPASHEAPLVRIGWRLCRSCTPFHSTPPNTLVSIAPSAVIASGEGDEVRASLQGMERDLAHVLGANPLSEPLFQLMCHGVPTRVKAAVDRWVC